MDTKQRERKKASRLDWRPEAAELQVRAFYAELQQAVNEVDWAKVKLPKLRDHKRP
jgi:hypothetical protein